MLSPEEEVVTATATNPRLRHGPYHLLEELPSGPTAQVFIARRDEALEPCVLKCLAPEYRSGPIRQRFLREIAIAEHLEHPNIVRTLSTSSEGDELYLATEYIVGPSLVDVLKASSNRDAGLGFELAVAVVLRVLDALEFAHHRADAAGRHLAIVHRDVSPKNILVSTLGTVKVIDFGVARGKVDDYETAMGALIGTPRYMSPEQAQTLVVDARTDVYSAAVVLYELIARRHLIRAKSRVDIIRAVVHNEFPKASLLDPQVPVALDEVIARALAKDPDERIPSARTFRDELIAAVPSAGSVRDDDIADVIAARVDGAVLAAMARYERHRSAEPTRVDPVPEEPESKTVTDVRPKSKRAPLPRPTPRRTPKRRPTSALLGGVFFVATLAMGWILGAKFGAPTVMSRESVAIDSLLPTTSPVVAPRTSPPPSEPPLSPNPSATEENVNRGRRRSAPAREPSRPAALPPDVVALRRRLRALGETPDVGEAAKVADAIKRAARRTKIASVIDVVDREVGAFDFSGSAAPLTRGIDALEDHYRSSTSVSSAASKR